MKGLARSTSLSLQHPVKYRIFLSMLPLAAVFYSVVMGPSAAALSLPIIGEPADVLDKTLRTVLPQPASSKPSSSPVVASPASSPPTQTQSQAPSSTVSSTPSSQNAARDQSRVAATSVVVAAASPSSGELPKLPLLQLVRPSLATSAGVINNFPLTVGSTPRTLAGGNWLEPSEDGWRVMGVAWYWWLLLLVAGCVALKYTLTNALRRTAYTRR